MGCSIVFLLLTGLIAVDFSRSKDLIINVSQSHGKDDVSCLGETVVKPENRPCRSLHFAYTKKINQITNMTYSLTINLMDDKYNIYEPFIVDIDCTNLKKLIFQGSTRTRHRCTYFMSKEISSGVYVGGTNKSQAGLSSYGVVFQNLCWSNFTWAEPATLTVFNVKSLSIRENRFADNNCSAINAVDTGINITDSYFINNDVDYGVNISWPDYNPTNFTSFPASNHSAGGAVAIIFLQLHNYSSVIHNCTFTGNSAVAHSVYSRDNRYIYINSTVFQFELIGGGMAVAFAGNSSGNTVKISQCLFSHNSAFAGAGVGIVTQDTAMSNAVLLEKCSIVGNRATTSAGGVLFVALVEAHFNKLTLQACVLKKNSARDGGGMKIFYHSERRSRTGHIVPSAQVTKLIRTTLCDNVAKVASAIHLLYIKPTALKPTVPVRFEDCRICHHSPEELISRGPAPYTGALLSNRVDIEFCGKNRIYRNRIESAVYVSNAVVNISGIMMFDNNAAETSGGAMSLRDVSYLYLSPGTRLKFLNNFAKFQGGAIYVQGLGLPEVVYPYNPSCFLQYTVKQVPASQWKILLEFRGNMAGFKGAAIYVNTISSCSWKDTPPYVDFSAALRWSNSFVYLDNHLLVEYEKFHKIIESGQDVPVPRWPGDINTDTSEFKISYKNPVYASPGEVVLFNLSGYDELHNPVYSVAVATDFSQNVSAIQEDELFLNDRYYAVPPHPQVPAKLSYTASPSEYRKIMKYQGEEHVIQFVDSFSSFISNANLSIIPVPCRPGMVFNKKQGVCVCNTQIPGVVRCAGNIIYVEQGTWANVTFDQKLVTYACPDQYCACSRPKRGKVFLGCPFNVKHPDNQCSVGRQGMLCGHCRPGYGLSVFNHECKKCSSKSSPVVAFVLLVLVIFFIAIVVVVINPGFSTYLRGPIFYGQMLPYLFQPYDTVGKVVRAASLLVDLGGPGSLPFDGCIKEDFSSLDSILLSYIFPGIIFTVLLAAYILHKCRFLNFRRNSPFEGFWILIVAMYKFLAETSLLLFFCVPIEGHHLFFFDGSITCFQSEHIPGAIVGLIVICVFVIPPPFLVFLISLGYVRVQPQITDALTKGLRKSFRWWWSFDLARRLVFVAFYVFIPDWDNKQVALTLTSLIIFTIHAQCKPYKARFANVGETCLLFALTLVSMLQLVDASDFRITLTAVTVILTTAYMAIITIYVSVNFVRRRLYQKGYSNITDLDEDFNSRTRSRISQRISPDAICVQCTQRDCTRHQYTPCNAD